MSEYVNGYRTGKSEAYAIAALVVLKVNDANDAAAILRELASVANETNSSTVESGQVEAKDAV